jgi:hypothetical protein
VKPFRTCAVCDKRIRGRSSRHARSVHPACRRVQQLIRIAHRADNRGPSPDGQSDRIDHYAAIIAAGCG